MQLTQSAQHTDQKRGRGNPSWRVGVSANPGGRPKVTQTEKALEIMREEGFCPVRHMIKLAISARSEKVQAEATSKLLDRYAPALKAIEHSIEAGVKFELKIIHPNSQTQHKQESGIVIDHAA